jgi:hypothetical protein
MVLESRKHAAGAILRSIPGIAPSVRHNCWATLELLIAFGPTSSSGATLDWRWFNEAGLTTSSSGRRHEARDGALNHRSELGDGYAYALEEGRTVRRKESIEASCMTTRGGWLVWSP